MGTPANRPRRGQFHLRWLFAWTTAVAVAVAACSGAFGTVVQTVAILYLLFPLLLLASGVLVGGPWLGLVWCFRLITKLTKRGTAGGGELAVSD